LNNAAVQNAVFSVDGVNTVATSVISIKPVPAVAASMTLNQDIAAPTGAQVTWEDTNPVYNGYTAGIYVF
jgi:hypothetical protein